MAKVTYIELKPDDPIFHRGAEIFKPVSRPKTKDSEKESTPPINPMREKKQEKKK